MNVNRAHTLGLIMPLAEQRGGAERLFVSLLRTKEHKLGYKILFLEEGPLVQEIRELGYDTHVLHATHLRDVRNYISTVQQIRSWIRLKQVDLVFSWMLKAHLYAGPAALLSGRRRMWFQHGISKRHWMDIIGSWMPAEGVLCCSAYVKQLQEARLASPPAFECHPGIQLSAGKSPTKEIARELLGLRLEGGIVCMVARLERWKGAHILIEAASLVVRLRPDTTFCIIGGPHAQDRGYAEELHALCIESNLGDRLRLLGQLPAEEVALWQASADLIAHPVTDAEPFGIAVVEALAAGKAVVASRAGGVPEIIQDGVNGVFVSPGDHAQLAQQIVRLLDDVETRERMEVAAISRANDFSIDRFVARFENLLLSALHAGKA